MQCFVVSQGRGETSPLGLVRGWESRLGHLEVWASGDREAPSGQRGRWSPLAPETVELEHIGERSHPLGD